MEPPAEPTIETLRFTTPDDVELTGDLATPGGGRTRPIAAAIVCHPHPGYGGNRFGNVVTACFEALPARGIATLRFDFRPAFGHGVAERADAAAGLGVLRSRWPETPLVAVGYSFGAMVVLGLDDAALAGEVLIAPPLSRMPAHPGAELPRLVLSPAHDQFTPPDVAAPIVASWDGAVIEEVEMADHFLTGRAAFAAGRVAEWIGALVER